MYEYKRFQDLDRSDLDAMNDYKLCYVERKDNEVVDGEIVYHHYSLYFTTLRMEDQWGDDWDDAPYEYNAEVPYDGDYVDEKWVETTILVLSFMVDADNHLLMPEDGHWNSPHCVADINSGRVAWLYKESKGKACNGIAVHAGMTPQEVVWKIGHLMVNF